MFRNTTESNCVPHCLAFSSRNDTGSLFFFFNYPLTLPATILLHVQAISSSILDGLMASDGQELSEKHGNKLQK
jgi:hypothetical protein